MNNFVLQTLLNNLKSKNPKGYSFITQAMQNNGNPEAMLKQMMSNATPEQKEGLFKQAKQYGCPDNILSQIQNMK